MATPVRIPEQDTIYDAIRIALNQDRYDDIILLYNMLTPHQHEVFSQQYPEIYILLLNKIYMCQKVTTATLFRDS